MSKKEQIFEAVIEHIKNEGFLKNLTIANIAKKADVGKGTIYEYFNSKEEVIAETIVYMLEKNSLKIYSQSNELLNFEDSLRHLIKTTMGILIENTNIHTILMSEESCGLINRQLKQKMMIKIMKLKNAYNDYLMSILNKGVNEGRFNTVSDPFTIVAISNAIVTNNMYFIHNSSESQYKEEEFIDKVYQLILKIVA